MTTTNWELAENMQDLYPHTFNALQNLTMAMADYQSSRAKLIWLGQDQALAAYKHLEDMLRDTLLAMVLDGAVKRLAEPKVYRKKLLEFIDAFAAAFPNWQDAYAFAREYLVSNASEAEGRIAQMMHSSEPMASANNQTPGKAVVATAGAGTSNGLATASLVCGIGGIAYPLSILFFACIAAIICGHIALGNIKRSPLLYGGKGRAIVGLVLGYLGAVIGLLLGLAIALMRISLKQAM